MRRRLVFLSAVLASMAACGGLPGGSEPDPTTTTSPPGTTMPPVTTTPAPDPTSATTPPLDVITSGDLDIIVVPIEGELPADLVVQCPNGPVFPFGALTEISRLDDDDPEGFLEAIAPFLANEEGQFWPQEGWRLLHQGEEEAVLVASTADGNLAYMHLSRDGDQWQWSGSSINGNPCDLQYTVPEQLHTVEWELDPEGPGLSPETTELHVLLTERNCASGLEIGDRLFGPQVVMTAEAVHIAFAAEPPPGDFQTCPGIAPAPYVIELPAPLGDREVIPRMNIGHSLEDYLD